MDKKEALKALMDQSDIDSLDTINANINEFVSGTGDDLPLTDCFLLTNAIKKFNKNQLNPMLEDI